MPLSSLFKRQRAKFEVAETPAGIVTQDLNVHGTKLKVNEGDYESNQKIKLGQGVELSLSGAKLTGRFNQSGKVTISGYGGRLHVDRDVLHSNETLDMTVGALEIRENSVFSDSSHYGSGSDKFYTKGNPGSITRVDFDGFLILNDRLQFVNEREYNLQKKEPEEKEAPTVVELENAEMVSIPSMPESIEDQSAVTEPTSNPKVVNTPSVTENPSVSAEIQNPAAQPEKVKHSRAFRYDKEIFDLEKYAKKKEKEIEFNLVEWEIFPFVNLSVSIQPKLNAHFDAMVGYDFMDEPPATVDSVKLDEMMNIFNTHKNENVNAKVEGGIAGNAGLALTAKLTAGSEKIASLSGGVTASADLKGTSKTENLPGNYIFTATGRAPFRINDEGAATPITFLGGELNLEAAAALTASLDAFIKGKIFGYEKDLVSKQIDSWKLGDFKTGARLKLVNHEMDNNPVTGGTNLNQFFTPGNNFKFAIIEEKELEYEAINSQFESLSSKGDDINQHISEYEGIYNEIKPKLVQLNGENLVEYTNRKSELSLMLQSQFSRMLTRIKDYNSNLQADLDLLKEQIERLNTLIKGENQSLEAKAKNIESRITTTQMADQVEMSSEEKKVLRQRVMDELTTPERIQNHELTLYNDKTEKHRRRLILLLLDKHDDFATEEDKYAFTMKVLENPESIYEGIDMMELHRRAELYKLENAGFMDNLSSALSPQQILDYEKGKVQQSDKTHDETINQMNQIIQNLDLTSSEEEKQAKFKENYKSAYGKKGEEQLKEIEKTIRNNMLQFASWEDLVAYERSKLGLTEEELTILDGGQDLFKLFTESIENANKKDSRIDKGNALYYLTYQDVIRYEEERKAFYMKQVIENDHQADDSSYVKKTKKDVNGEIERKHQSYQTFAEIYGDQGSIAEMLSYENKQQVEFKRIDESHLTTEIQQAMKKNEIRINVLNDLMKAYRLEQSGLDVDENQLNKKYMEYYINILRNEADYREDEMLSQRTRDALGDTYLADDVFKAAVSGDIYSKTKDAAFTGKGDKTVLKHDVRIKFLEKLKSGNVPFIEGYDQYTKEFKADGFERSNIFKDMQIKQKKGQISTYRSSIFEINKIEKTSIDSQSNARRLTALFKDDEKHSHLTRYKALKGMQGKPIEEVRVAYQNLGGGKGYNTQNKDNPITPSMFVQYEEQLKLKDREKHQKRVETLSRMSMDNKDEFLGKYKNITISDQNTVNKFRKQIIKFFKGNVKTGLDKSLEKEEFYRQLSFQDIVKYEIDRVKHYGGQKIHIAQTVSKINDQSTEEERQSMVNDYKESNNYHRFKSSLRAERNSIFKQRQEAMNKTDLNQLQTEMLNENLNKLKENDRQLKEIQNREIDFRNEIRNIDDALDFINNKYKNPQDLVKDNTILNILNLFKNRKDRYREFRDKLDSSAQIAVTPDANGNPQGDE